MLRISNLRCSIAGLLAVASALNYWDRQNFPLAVKVVQNDIPLRTGNTRYSNSHFCRRRASCMPAGAESWSDWGAPPTRSSFSGGRAPIFAWTCQHRFVAALVHQHPGCRKHKFTAAGVCALVKSVFEAGYGEGFALFTRNTRRLHAFFRGEIRAVASRLNVLHI
jgi:hypothetical protein